MSSIEGNESSQATIQFTTIAPLFLGKTWHIVQALLYLTIQTLSIASLSESFQVHISLHAVSSSRQPILTEHGRFLYHCRSRDVRRQLYRWLGLVRLGTRRRSQSIKYYEMSTAPSLGTSLIRSEH